MSSMHHGNFMVNSFNHYVILAQLQLRHDESTIICYEVIVKEL